MHGTEFREVSYRFTANRFDWMKWSNYAEGKNKGSILEEK